MIVRRTATTALIGLLAACSLAPARGSTAFTEVVVSMAAVSTVAVALTAVSVAEDLTGGAVDLPDAAASIMVADSRAVVSEAVPEAGSTAAVDSMAAVAVGSTVVVVVDSTVAVAATAADIAN
jgi:hypothetical protein